MMPTAKLTADDVRRIRALTGTMKQKEIAAMYGVSRDCIGDIQRGIRWTHVD
jgi:transposase